MVHTLYESAKQLRMIHLLPSYSGPMCGPHTSIGITSPKTIRFPHGAQHGAVNGTNYTTNVVCEWTITAPTKFAIRLDFDFFQLEFDRRCVYDSVEFFEGPDSNSPSLKGRYCGDNRPIDIQSRRNQLTVRLVSDYSIVGGGFSFNWSLNDAQLPR